MQMHRGLSMRRSCAHHTRVLAQPALIGGGRLTSGEGVLHGLLAKMVAYDLSRWTCTELWSLARLVVNHLMALIVFV